MTARQESRRRAAPVAVATSDETRFRSYGIAALVLAFTVVGLVVLGGGASSLRAPGPLAKPHQELACGACHGRVAGERTADACVGCHGAHPSARAAHGALERAGRLECGGCHAVHRAESGLAFETDGSVTHFGTGFERVLVSANGDGRRAGVRGNVPLVAASACAACHDGDRETDPAWSCFPRDPAGTSSSSLCFDEHRRPAGRSGARAAERDALVERARSFAPRLRSERFVNVAASGANVALGAALAALALAAVRRKQRRKEHLASRPPPNPGGRRLPVIDASRCLGCQACVDACPYDALEMSRYVAVLTRPEQCCGAGPCLVACPNGSLVLGASGNSPEPRLSGRLESLEHPGVFFVGDASGGSLVRTAVEQGAQVAKSLASELGTVAVDGGSDAPFDVVVVGAGPAGLSTALEAKRLGLRAVVLEQASIAESVRRFSRQKLVHGAESADAPRLPLFIGDATKEELLRRWLREVRTRCLDVRERTRVAGIESIGRDSFVLRAADASGADVAFAGRRVVVAIGRRGSPRELRALVADAAVARVHYELSDARAFAGCRAIVVGLGDVAMETALALALQPGTRVTVVHRGSGFSRGRQKNVEALGRLVAEGRVGLLFDAEVQSVGAERLLVRSGTQEHSLAYDALFVHIGAEAPGGIRIARAV